MGIPDDPMTRLMNFAKEYKKRKLRRDTISELLIFIETEKIGDDNKDFQYYITVLRSAIFIVKRIVRKRISLEPQFEVVENERRLKSSMMILTTSMGLLQQSLIGTLSCTIHIKRIYCMKANYHIDFTEDILDDDAKFYQEVKEVIRVIISLLKDRVDIDEF
ncbi:hypothetical protein C1645_841778 [Glomus cerebriforme]|uniref:Uncharacterized protein n=1 Tax=Glomus cerebriforme TaxID=658196 RepID=A0A397S3S6_9GLOM|nr:hypothetical protein C1645_841778 [Glomus cerebriforme]